MGSRGAFREVPEDSGLGRVFGVFPGGREEIPGAGGLTKFTEEAQPVCSIGR